MKRLAIISAAMLAVLAAGAGAAVLAAQSTVTATITVPYTIGGKTGSVVVSKEIEVPTVTETVTQTVTVTQPTTTTTPPPTTTTPPPPPPSDGQVFLSPSGSDSAPCTQAAPCRSMQRGAAVAQDGQTVSMAAGDYPQQQLQNVQKAVTFEGPAHVADLSLVCTTGVTIKDVSAMSLAILAGNNNLTVKGGKFGYGTYRRSVENDPVVLGNVGSCTRGTTSHNIVLDGLTVGGYVYPGGDEGSAHPDCLQFYGGNDGVTLRNSTFDGCDDSYIGGYPDFGDIRNIVIENNTFSNIEESSSYFFSQWGQPGHPYRCDGITWRGNTIHSNLPLRTECWNMVVEGNTFDAPGPGDYNCETWAQRWNAVWRDNTFLRGEPCVTG